MLQLSLDEKVSLFRSLFRGREDVFARRYKSKDKKEEIIEALKGMSPEKIAEILSVIQKIVIFASRQIAHVEL